MTKQACERIDFWGETYLTDRYPLEQCAVVHDVLAAYRNHNTGCRRGYVGHWCIENDMLLLCDAQKAVDPGPGISLLTLLSCLLPSRQDGRFVAVWYSGEIELQADNSWPDRFVDSTYVKYQVLIEAGKVIHIEHSPVYDQPAQFPDVNYEELPSFLKQQSE